MEVALEREREQQIRDLAYGLWLSADGPEAVALEYWLMAETMVTELSLRVNGKDGER